MPGIFFIPQSTVRANNPKVILLPTQSWVFPGMFMLRESCTCSTGFCLLLSIRGARIMQSLHASWLWIWRQSIIHDELREMMEAMANIIPLHWKWILSYASWWCQVHHALAFYFPHLSLPPPWTSSQLQITLAFGGCASCLTCQQFKVMATKISTKICVLVFFFPLCIYEKPRLVHCDLQASWWHCKKEAVLCWAVTAMHVIPTQHCLHTYDLKSMKCQTQL